jgi:hypothetical protein
MKIIPAGAGAGRRSHPQAKELATKEGIFVGITRGDLAARCALPGSAQFHHPRMLPDTGERYLSTPLFADIPADMTAEESLSRSRRRRRRWAEIVAVPALAGP